MCGVGLLVYYTSTHAARLKVRIFFQPNVVLVSRFKIVIRFRARAVYLFSYGISRAEFSLGNRYLM